MPDFRQESNGRADWRRPRTLVLRSCRPLQFAAAVAGIRARQPDAEIVALSHAGHADALGAAGVDRVIECPGRRFGLWRVAPSLVRRLRREQFDEIVVPQMTVHPEGHGNLYRLASVLGGRRVTVLPGDRRPVTASTGWFALQTCQVTCLEALGWFQRPVFVLLLLAAALCSPRRKVAPKPRRRVLHIISSLGVGGAQRQLAELVNRTPADAYDVDVLVLGAFDGEFARQWLGRADVRVRYLAQWPRLAPAVLEVRRLCVEGGYDLVHTWLFMANVIGVAGARLAGTPRIVASVRNLSLWKRTWYRQWWFRAADVMSTWAADVVTVNAQALVEDHARWARYPARRIHVIHNGLEPAPFALDRRDARTALRALTGVGDEAVVVATVGRLAPEKDQATFLKVIHAVRRVRPHVHGVVVGDGQLRPQLEALAAELGIAGAGTFARERSDARALLAGADAFVLTSTIEGFPNVLLEAAFLGVPALASDVGGSADVLGNPLATFAPGDVAAAAERLVGLLDGPAAAAARAEECRQRALHLFTADRSASRWFALYADRAGAHDAPDDASALTPRPLTIP